MYDNYHLLPSHYNLPFIKLYIACTALYHRTQIKTNMLQKTQIKKRYSKEISEDPSSDEKIVAGNDNNNDSDNNIDENQKNKRTKERIENKQSSSERVTSDVNDDNPTAWLSALTERIRTDNRIGFPKKQPHIAELNHGWLMDANKEVLHALIKPEFSKRILLSEHTISLKCIPIINVFKTLSFI